MLRHSNYYTEELPKVCIQWRLLSHRVRHHGDKAMLAAETKPPPFLNAFDPIQLQSGNAI